MDVRENEEVKNREEEMGFGNLKHSYASIKKHPDICALNNIL